MATDAPAAGELTARSATVSARIGQWAASPVRVLMIGLDRVATRLDGPARQTTGAIRLRRAAGLMIGVYALVFEVQSAAHGKLLSPIGAILLILPFALWTNRGGRFLRDWVPVLVGLIAYGTTVSAVPGLGLGVHYVPQIDADRILGFGTLPTEWLQAHLYNGHTGLLELFSLTMYLSHFFAPVLLGFLLWVVWDRRGFADLFFGILAVSILGDITFMLAPTAPPWLAAEHGLIPNVSPIIKDTLFDLHLNAVAINKGDASSYNIVAAVPSLHAAWPVICLLVIRKYRLPRWLFVAQALLTVGVVFAIVYTGEHYLIDAIVGALYALGAWWLLQRVLTTRRDRAALPSRPADAELSARTSG
jgi:hypothetical protein